MIAKGNISDYLPKKVKALLVQPKYYSPFPPLPLLKLAALFPDSRLVYYPDMPEPEFMPNVIFVTSLFTWTWESVRNAVYHYSQAYPKAEVILGGIYASLMPEHAESEVRPHIVWVGQIPEAEDLMPRYDLVPENTKSIVFASRGCVRRCLFCAVPKLEPTFEGEVSISHLVCPGHSEIVLLDNNFLASPHKSEVLSELVQLRNKKGQRYLVDFNQGLDARLVTPEIASALRRLRMRCVRLAYDYYTVRNSVAKAIAALIEAGFRGRDIVVYTLYGWNDSPEDFFQRIRDMAQWGVSIYPMRYQPTDALEKNAFIPERWSREELEMVFDAQRALGFRGVWLPREALRRKFLEALNFARAMELRPRETKKALSRN